MNNAAVRTRTLAADIAPKWWVEILAMHCWSAAVEMKEVNYT